MRNPGSGVTVSSRDLWVEGSRCGVRTSGYWGWDKRILGAQSAKWGREWGTGRSGVHREAGNRKKEKKEERTTKRATHRVSVGAYLNEMKEEQRGKWMKSWNMELHTGLNCVKLF
jgi:hypothetical protein